MHVHVYMCTNSTKVHTVYIHILVHVHVRVQTVPKNIQCTVVHTCTYTFCMCFGTVCTLYNLVVHGVHSYLYMYVYKQYKSTYSVHTELYMHALIHT